MIDGTGRRDNKALAVALAPTRESQANHLPSLNLMSSSNYYRMKHFTVE